MSNTENKTSLALGIIGIITSVIIPICAIVCGVIGLCIYQRKARDISLNVIAIVLGSCMWILNILVLGGLI